MIGAVQRQLRVIEGGGSEGSADPQWSLEAEGVRGQHVE